MQDGVTAQWLSWDTFREKPKTILLLWRQERIQQQFFNIIKSKLISFLKFGLQTRDDWIKEGVWIAIHLS